MPGGPRTNKRSRPSNPDVFISGVPQIPLETFFSSLLHPVSSGVCSEVRARLMKQNRLVQGSWTESNRDSTPRNSLKALETIFDAVVGAATDVFAGSLGTVQTEFILSSCDPNSNTFEYLPHAQFQLMSHNADDGHPWLSTAIPWRSDEDAYDPKSNHENIIWNCHDVLREDPRRRFIFGITLDATEMRLWFFSRTHHVVSESVDFAKEPDSLIRLFLIIAFAMPEHLGYDATMSYFVDDSKTVQFRLSLNDVVYVTKRLLSDNRSNVICGRATRVWEAYREDDPDRTSVVIKDLWTSIDVVQEGVQLLELHERLRALGDPGTPRPPGDYFLTVLAHGFVKTTDGIDDHTVDVMMRAGTFPVDSANHSPRKHYRIVFKEVGVALDRLLSLSETFQALADATRALSLLHRLGFVHRDVSAGNILLVDGVGKLSDLEFIESFGKLVFHAGLPGIGTPEYTSVEVAFDCYLWMPSPATMPVIEKPAGDAEDTMPPFRFNPLHDLESTLWIAFWALSYHRRNDDVHARVLDKYFHERPSDQGIDIISRMMAMKAGFPRPPIGDSSTLVTDLLNLLRRLLLDQYIAFEQDFDARFALLHTPALATPLDIARLFVDRYEMARAFCGATCPSATEKPNIDQESSHPIPSSISPDRRPKKLGSATKNSVTSGNTSTLPSGGHKVRSSGMHAARRSSRLAARKKT
ncbi:hypothetical protein DFH07DRAFT_573529 [Mycena maculata]|uniref:Fungal-type protein kinase domain-containing protein n=1 Tax=Mycena maculata TaxID=230809 RepID=A0AAD7IRA1_9AGAR|nr:hypothetical protein DFH07DRAFT_573529 [Mycena maculata]